MSFFIGDFFFLSKENLRDSTNWIWQEFSVIAG